MAKPCSDAVKFLISKRLKSIKQALFLKKDLKKVNLVEPIGNSAYRRSVGEDLLLSNDRVFLSSAIRKDNSFVQTLNKVDRRQTGLNIVSKKSFTTIPLSLIKTKEDDTLRLNDNLYLNVQSNTQKLRFSGLIKSDSLSLSYLKKPNTSQLLDFIPSSASHWQILALNADASNEIEATYFNPNPILCFLNQKDFHLNITCYYRQTILL